MTHEEAVAIIKGPREPGAEGYRKYAHACTEVYLSQVARTDHPAPPRATTTTDKGKPMARQDVHARVDAIAAVWGVAQKRKATRDTRTIDWSAATPEDFKRFGRAREATDIRAAKSAAARVRDFWSRQAAHGGE